GVGNGLLPDGMSLAGDPPHAHRINASPIVPSHSHDMQHTHNIPSHMHNLILQNHFHQITIPQHSHTVNIQPHSHSVNIPNHQHQITIPPHQHNLTLPNHTHDIEFGIWQGQTASNVSIRVDNNTIPLPQGTDLSNLDAIPFLRRGQGGNGTD
ncbi:MAG: hypothetical protein FWF50_03980, partial [Defluviitaleaceae bacterium]|nr:hypothetical protein [Defluviitaleaceae bacterium]